jgi:pimeloyl-ACP methyl ester carboxylesterase
MGTFVLVHGAWTGGWVWKPVAAYLERAGHAVYRPTVTGLGERAHLLSPAISRETHLQDLVNVLVYEDLTDVVLAGWSYGAWLIAGVAQRLPERVAHLVHVDGELAQQGRGAAELYGEAWTASMRERARTEGDGWLLPPHTESYPSIFPDPTLCAWVQARMTPHVLRWFEEPLAWGNPAAEEIPQTVITFVAQPDDGQQAVRAAQYPEMAYRELEASHWGHVTRPADVADLLLGALQHR